MRTANEFGHVLIKALKDAGMNVVIVNDEVDEDSVIEHDLDLDINDHEGVDYTLYITVMRIGEAQ